MSEQHRILIVLTSHGDLGGRRSTGAYAPEAAEPWVVFTQAGCAVDVASVAGGRPPFDGVDLDDADQRSFFEAVDLDEAPALADIPLDRYDAVFYAGGHGTMWDFPAPAVASSATTVWASGGVVAAVCHGPAALTGALAEDGTPLVAGRRITGFTNDEERAAGVDDVVPFLLADRLAELGGRYEQADSFTQHVVTDGRLVTGQNPQSARAAAKAVLEALSGSAGAARTGAA
jgi:putative intracellular protease/amidase